MLQAEQAGDARIAVIEAATAAEVALGRCLHDRLGDLPQDARERIIFDTNGVVGLLRLVEAINGVSQSASKRVADRLANPRNLAVHAGEAPEDVDSALAEARSILEQYAPLPLPDETAARPVETSAASREDIDSAHIDRSAWRDHHGDLHEIDGCARGCRRDCGL